MMTFGDVLRNKQKQSTESARALHTIADEIRADWKKPYYGAVPYIEAMSQLITVNGTFGAEDGRSVVLYFLSNASTWRGEVARRIKKELNAMIKR